MYDQYTNVIIYIYTHYVCNYYQFLTITSLLLFIDFSCLIVNVPNSNEEPVPTYKFLHSNGPRYCLDILSWYTPTINLRSSFIPMKSTISW